MRARTGSRVNVQVFSNAVLGDQPKAVSMLKAGELDMGEFGLAPLTEAVPSMKAITLPFLFQDAEHMFRHMDGAMGDKFKERLSAAGFVVIGWYDGGARSFYCVGKRVQGPRDFAGLRIRVQGTEIFKGNDYLAGRHADDGAVQGCEGGVRRWQDRLRGKQFAIVHFGRTLQARQVFLSRPIMW